MSSFKESSSFNSVGAGDEEKKVLMEINLVEESAAAVKEETEKEIFERSSQSSTLPFLGWKALKESHSLIVDVPTSFFL